ncbi:PASTA domain-containing protein [Isobaculum melis]|uniref:Lipoprotein n=1 Tax=Isobaculum melis TaxID=142588 RepID=A0A1H9SE84_9LACT|nr:hypothetical protein [Isobaculum melis]SER82499.1 hypothetical protein SAMN04488559_10719 [Isobaculum melis]
MKKISGFILTLLLVITLTGCGPSEKEKEKAKEDKIAQQKKEDEKAAQKQADKDQEDFENYREKLIGKKVKLPDTFGKSKSEAEALYKTVDLNVKFVPGKTKSVQIGGCYAEYVSPGVLKYDLEGYNSEYYGYYAEPGSTIILAVSLENLNDPY